MYKVIKYTIDKHKDSQANISSDAFRTKLASEIEQNIKSDNLNTSSGIRFHANHLAEGIVNEWICEYCDEDTSEVDYDYIGSGTNHLSCELEAGK
jgi:hypothetical protein|tara:strand:- start:3240 stop:3524 length:285 start_codon:yes stop_codon:yes gene_type:complete